jgi:hypothetical protein
LDLGNGQALSSSSSSSSSSSLKDHHHHHHHQKRNEIMMSPDTHSRSDVAYSSALTSSQTSFYKQALALLAVTHAKLAVEQAKQAGRKANNLPSTVRVKRMYGDGDMYEGKKRIMSVLLLMIRIEMMLIIEMMI